MSARTCPKCRHQYRPKAYFNNLLFKSLGDFWACPNCGAELRFDRRRRLLVALGSGFWLLVLLLMKNHFGLKGAENLWLLPLIPFGALFYLLDRFRPEEP